MRYSIRRYLNSRFWAVWDGQGGRETLVCVTVYRKGAQEVCRRLCGIGVLPQSVAA